MKHNCVVDNKKKESNKRTDKLINNIFDICTLVECTWVVVASENRTGQNNSHLNSLAEILFLYILCMFFLDSVKSNIVNPFLGATTKYTFHKKIHAALQSFFILIDFQVKFLHEIVKIAFGYCISVTKIKFFYPNFTSILELLVVIVVQFHEIIKVAKLC